MFSKNQVSSEFEMASRWCHLHAGANPISLQALSLSGFHVEKEFLLQHVRRDQEALGGSAPTRSCKDKKVPFIC